jgi:hypothetical protein
VIWKDNRIQTNQANLVLPDNKVASSKIARNRNVSANSVSAKNKEANRAVGVANRAVAANKVASKADDKPGYLERKRREATPAAFFLPQIKRYRFAVSVKIVLRDSSPFPATATVFAPRLRGGRFSLARSCCW